MKKINKKLIVFLLCLLLANNINAQNCSYKIKYAYRSELNNTNLKILHYIFFYDNTKLYSIFRYNYITTQLEEVIMYEYKENEIVGKLSIDGKGNITNNLKPIFDSVTKKYLTIPRLDIDISMCPSSNNNGSMNMRCKRDVCGNVIEEIEYSPINKKRILSKYVYEYVY
jgi:hypothetical protein